MRPAPRLGWPLALAALAVCGLAAGCHSAKDAAATPGVQSSASAAPMAGPADTQQATPMNQRVATLGLLNKRNNEVQDIVLKPGEFRQIGNVRIKLAACEKTAPWERAPETGAFVQLWVEERASVEQPLAWHAVFSGWLFKNAPALNVVQHPVYDVWVKDCAMNFPGQEEKPEDSAVSSKAPKAAGSASAEDDVTPPPPAVNEADAGEAGN